MARTKLAKRLRRAFGPARPEEHSVDEGLWEVAAMVYVGDVYAVLVADQANGAATTSDAKQDADAALWPFIR